MRRNHLSIQSASPVSSASTMVKIHLQGPGPARSPRPESDEGCPAETLRTRRRLQNSFIFPRRVSAPLRASLPTRRRILLPTRPATSPKTPRVIPFTGLLLRLREDIGDHHKIIKDRPTVRPSFKRSPNLLLGQLAGLADLPRGGRNSGPGGRRRFKFCTPGSPGPHA